MVYVIQVCKTAFEQDQDGTVVSSWSCSKAVHLVGFIIKKFVKMHNHKNVKCYYTLLVGNWENHGVYRRVVLKLG